MSDRSLVLGVSLLSAAFGIVFGAQVAHKAPPTPPPPQCSEWDQRSYRESVAVTERALETAERCLRVLSDIADGGVK